MYKLITYSDPSLGMLAASNKKGEIWLNTEGTPENFQAYFKGEIPSPSSQQKRVVLKRLEALGWTQEKIFALVGNRQNTRRFLILHEISHLNHKDDQVYHQASEPKKVEIETRACLEALTQLAQEYQRKSLPC